MNTCGHCGSNLTPADLSQPACRYCGTVFAHYARAAEKVAVVNALMGDANRNGIPDVLEGAARLGTTPAGLPHGAGQPVVIVHSAVVLGGGQVPPMTGGPVGYGGYPGPPGGYAPPMYGGPVTHPARRGGSGVAVFVIIGALFVFGLVGGLAALLVLAR
jgi:hypothetical protein